MEDSTASSAPVAGGMHVHALLRYPVKSMLGEAVATLFVDEHGADGDRRLALLDVDTGHVASAKNARLWRGLLKCTATADVGRVTIGLPDGTSLAADDPGIDDRLSRLLGRPVRLIAQRPEGATLVRPDPEKLLELGLDAEVGGRILRIAQATPGDAFTDEAPLHAITTATLEHVGVEALRYRPNVVITTPPDYPPYAENDWVGRDIAIGAARVRALTATSRCVVPTLEHGPLPRAPQALRTPATENRWDTGGHGAQPCAGAYLAVVAAGVIRVGDRVTIG
ncbi:molybdenum cofactor biosysynthesis protein [Mycobacterium malmoense]|nr:MOSC N-terminal beta barrel domain-containing protein [Mycobacterium malmoense]OCB28072.1 molybdenum cofactor biosysynthesis protein [Mycobacterium malmoense]